MNGNHTWIGVIHRAILVNSDIHGAACSFPEGRSTTDGRLGAVGTDCLPVWRLDPRWRCGLAPSAALRENLHPHFQLLLPQLSLPR